MQKGKGKRIHEAQGQKSRMISMQNHIRVFNAIAREPLSFSELLKETGFSRPVLAKHLRNMQADGTICKDTIKANEALNAREVGKVVYRLVESSQLLSVIIDAFWDRLELSNPNFDEKSKAEVRQHLEGIARVTLRHLQECHRKKISPLSQKTT